MVVELVTRVAGIVGRLVGLSTGLVGGRLARLLRRLAEQHLRLAQEEAAEEAQRLLRGLALGFVALVCLSGALLMSNLVVVFALREFMGVEWLTASVGALGLDLVLTVLFGLGAASVLRGPYMSRTRKTMAETLEVLRDDA